MSYIKCDLAITESVKTKEIDRMWNQGHICLWIWSEYILFIYVYYDNGNSKVAHVHYMGVCAVGSDW